MRNPYNAAVKCKLAREGYLDVTLTGDSMLPILQMGDVAHIEPITSMEEGFLYLFELPDGSLGVHRMVGTSCEFVLMKGDNCKRIERVERDRAIGEVKYVRSSSPTALL